MSWEQYLLRYRDVTDVTKHAAIIKAYGGQGSLLYRILEDLEITIG